MNWRLLAFTSMLVFLLAGCDTQDDGCGVVVDDYPASPGQPPVTCVRPLADLCQRGCRSYDEDVRALENDVTRGACAGVLASVRLGTCGELRFTATGHAFGGTTRYYDASGTLVAARTRDDVLVLGAACDDPPFGFSPECQKVVTRDLCLDRTPAP